MSVAYSIVQESIVTRGNRPFTNITVVACDPIRGADAVARHPLVSVC